MMRIFKSILVSLCFISYLLVASFLHIVIILTRPSSRGQLMSRLTRLLIGSLCSILGIKILLRGRREILKEKGLFLISPHVSYIDGLVLGSLIPAIFVSKKEIKNWPLIGKVVEISGTIFVNRQQKAELASCLEKISQELRNQMNILIFPEGTSSDGAMVLPFQSSFFSVPIVNRAPIVPVTIQYHRIDGEKITAHNRNEINWHNGMNFSSHVWNLLRHKRIEVQVTVHDKILTNIYSNTSVDRKKLAQKCHQLLSDFMGAPTNLPEEIRAI